MAIKILKGIKIKLAETTVEWPNNKAGSKPIRKSWPPNLDCKCLRACRSEERRVGKECASWHE